MSQRNVIDNIINLNSDFTSGTPSENAGLQVLRGDSSNVQIRWNETSDSWEAEVILDPTNRDLGWFDPSVRLETISVQREQSDQRFFRLRYETPDQ